MQIERNSLKYYSPGARMPRPQRDHVSAFGSQIALTLEGFRYRLVEAGGCSTTELPSVLVLALDIRSFFSFGTSDRSTISRTGFLTFALEGNSGAPFFFLFGRSASHEP